MNNRTSITAKILLYFGAIGLVLFGFNYMNNIPSNTSLTKQDPAAAQTEQTIQSKIVKATETFNQSGKTTSAKNQKAIWIGSTTQDDSFLYIQFPLESIPANTTYNSAKLLVTPTENSQVPTNVLIFAEKTQGNTELSNTKVAPRPLTAQFVLLNESKPWTKEKAVEIANLAAPLNEQIKFNPTAQKVTFIVKGLQQENSRRSIYPAGSEYPPELQIEFVE